MRVADGALREGLLYDLVGRFTDEDARVRSVRAMQARYHVDAAQAERVEASALDFLRQTTGEWQLDEPFAELVLSWAARLHEIGLDVSHSHYHKHGAYLLEHADMPGFPQEEQRILAAVVGAHRRKLNVQSLQDLTPPWHIKAEYLIVLLRLAVLLHRGRSATALPKIELHPKGRSLEIVVPEGLARRAPVDGDRSRKRDRISEGRQLPAARQLVVVVGPRIAAAAFPGRSRPARSSATTRA